LVDPDDIIILPSRGASTIPSTPTNNTNNTTNTTNTKLTSSVSLKHTVSSPASSLPSTQDTPTTTTGGGVGGVVATEDHDEVIGEAIIVVPRSRATSTLTSVSNMLPPTTTISTTDSGKETPSLLTRSQSERAPFTNNNNHHHHHHHNETTTSDTTTTTAANDLTKRPRHPFLRTTSQRVLTRASVKAIMPSKSWGADIAWGTVGEPGILDRKAFQNLRYKLIPQMLDAPWVIQMAVSSTPCLLGTKIVQRYYRGINYLEIDEHVGSSNIANNIVSMCRQYSKMFSCNIGVVIQGETDEELPERVLLCLTFVKIDPDALTKLSQPHVDYLNEILKNRA
jgi:hypothetical protein